MNNRRINSKSNHEEAADVAAVHPRQQCQPIGIHYRFSL